MNLKTDHLKVFLRTFVSRSRFTPILYVSVFFLILSMALRIAFVTISVSDAHLTVIEFPRIFLGGFLYDIVFACYASLPAVCVMALIPNRLLKKRWMRGCFIMMTYLVIYGILFVGVAEWFFWEEFQARFNFIAVDYLVYTHEVVANVVESYPLFSILAVITIASGLAIYGHVKLVGRMKRVEESPKTRWLIPVTLVILCSVFIIGIGQNVRSSSENNYVRELSSNGPYQFFAAFRNNSLDYRQFYYLGDDHTLSDRLKAMIGAASDGHMGRGLYDVNRHVKADSLPTRLNVILVTVESLSAKYLTRFGCTTDLTPRMDALIKKSLLFTNHYATGTRTVRGLEALTLSIPPTPGRSTIKRPHVPKYHSFGQILQSYGYDTAFIYGGHGMFDNMNAFFSKQGYRIIDQGDVTSEETTFSNAWGVCDGDLFNKTIGEADKARGKPFFFHLMTTSNHRPYTFPEGKIDAPQKHRSSAVRYTDFAIGRFIDDSRNKSWFKNTLFVVIADHCASSAGRAKLNLLKYHIPLFIYSPEHIAPREVDALSCQMDVPATLLALLGLSYDAPFFGQDILSEKFRPRALIGTYQKLGLLKNDRLMVLEPCQRISVLLPPWTAPKTKDVMTDDPILRDAQAYYQGADYILRHKLNNLTHRELQCH